NSPREALTLAMFHRGFYDVNTEDRARISRALEDLQALIPICNPVVDISNYQAIPQGKRVLGQAWSGDMITGAMWYMPEGVSSTTLQYWTAPKGQTSVQNDCWAVPAASKKPVLAHLWMNFLLD